MVEKGKKGPQVIKAMETGHKYDLFGKTYDLFGKTGEGFHCGHERYSCLLEASSFWTEFNPVTNRLPSKCRSKVR